MTSRQKCEPGCQCGKHSRSGGRGGVRAKCQPGCTCKKHVKTRKINWDDPEAKRAYVREYAAQARAADPAASRAAAKRWRDAHPGYYKGKLRNKGAELRWLYGITPERFAEMLAEQEGCCYLCGEPLDTETKRGVTVDHDHSCCRGQRSCGTCVRGLACGKCNAGIGHFGDDPERMRRVADNLEMANRRLRNPIPTRRGSDTAGRPGE